MDLQYVFDLKMTEKINFGEINFLNFTAVYENIRGSLIKAGMEHLRIKELIR